jgi:hypothetical protein
MNIKKLILESEEIVKQLCEGLNYSKISLKEAEEMILKHINKIGHIMTKDVLENIEEPTYENRVLVEGEEARYDGNRNIRFISRFGDVIRVPRRCYKYQNKGGGYYPLDEKLGLDKCGGYSPLMTYLQGLFGASEPYARSSELLSEALGYKLSATAVQRNAEMIGFKIDDNPLKVIGSDRENDACDIMLIEIDGTTSPQIHTEQGITGRESLKQPTEYKECNLVVIEKYNAGKLFDRFIGARYGPRKDFEIYARRAALKIGQIKAKTEVFIADGLASNWEIQKNNFPDAITILDFYHASEHLAIFCKLIKEKDKSKLQYKHWSQMLLDGETLQVIAEMKDYLLNNDDVTEGWSEIRYFQNNIDRMKYDEYKALGLPIGSGLVEGSCKFVIGKRFKGSGMRWKKPDNVAILKLRLAKLNERLADFFNPKPQKWTLWAA